MKHMTLPLVLAALLFFTGAGLDRCHVPRARAEVPGREPTQSNLFEKVRDTIHYKFEALAFGGLFDLEDSGADRHNNLHIPRYICGVQLRPDLYFNAWRLSVDFKPRAETVRWKWEDGVWKGRTETEEDLYVNEWEARLRVADEFFLAYGRLNLQWGPSYLLSPSNPFNRNNGRDDPQFELPGLDYAKAIYIPNMTWTLSFLANTGKGRQTDLDDFHETYALKLDYTGNRKFFSLIASHRSSEHSMFGLFGGWNLSDAVFLYLEGRASEKEDDRDFLIGGTYTFNDGSFLALEFFRNGDGCTRDPITVCALRLDEEQESGYLFMRRNYLLLQYINTRMNDNITITLRYTHDLDDDSSRAFGIVQYELNDHVVAFLEGNGYFGDGGSEYGSLLDYSVRYGVSITF